jgi:hypothetical protein
VADLGDQEVTEQRANLHSNLAKNIMLVSNEMVDGLWNVYW